MVIGREHVQFDSPEAESLQQTLCIIHNGGTVMAALQH